MIKDEMLGPATREEKGKRKKEKGKRKKKKEKRKPSAELFYHGPRKCNRTSKYSNIHPYIQRTANHASTEDMEAKSDGFIIITLITI